MLTNWTDTADGGLYVGIDVPATTARGLFTFRQGGVSEAPFDSLNIAYHVPDVTERVTENRRICSRWMGGELEDWIVPEQVHGTQVEVVTALDRGKGSVPEQPPVAGADGLITNESGLTLMVMSADCVPVLFLDPVARVIGVAHSGWKGTVGHIAGRVVEAMTTTFGSKPSDILAWMGPSVRRCCYEVDDRVAQPVRDAFGGTVLTPRHQKPGKYLLDLQACVRHDLVRAGVSAHHIQDVGLCSACRTNVLYSHRQEHGRTGRYLGAIRLAGAL